MIHIIEKKNCCGCSACASICPKSCITMKEDEEGFLYPHVDVRRYVMNYILMGRESQNRFLQQLIRILMLD